MTYKQFNSIIRELMRLKKDEDNLSKAFQRFEPDFNYICFSRYEQLVVDALKFGMNDENDWVGYFLYEMQGEFNTEPIGTEKDGTDIYIRNMRDLYNLIDV